jgi:hypothetical protein
VSSQPHGQVILTLRCEIMSGGAQRRYGRFGEQKAVAPVKNRNPNLLAPNLVIT